MKSKKNQFKQVTMIMATALLLIVVMYSCKKTSTKVTPPDTTTLSAAIDSAKWYMSNTHEGTQPGEYTKGTQAALQTALTSAQGVVANTSSTQAQVTAAAANLNAAIQTYKGGLITPIAASSLVAYWKFNGNANDSSGNGHNGTLEACIAPHGAVGLILTPGVTPGGVPALTADRFGNQSSAYHFSNGGHITVPYSPALNPKAITVSLWERQDTAGRVDHRTDCYMVSLSRWNGWKFQMQPTRPFFTANTDSADIDRDAALDIKIGATTGAGPWHHLVATYDGDSTEVFYVDGTPVKTWTNLRGAMKTITPQVDLSIGSDLPNKAYLFDSNGTDGNLYVEWGGYWTGDLDDIMIYNVALTATQITQIYNQQVTP